MIEGNNKDLQDTWLYKYREAIGSGEIIAGADMVTELDNLIHDFLMDPDFHYNTEKADIRIDFIESCVRLTKAPFYNKPMKLLLWEKAFIEVAYSFEIQSIDSGEWIQRFQEILLLITRKNGKTELIAALQLTELILGGTGKDIICSGTNDGTADLAYQAIDTMRLLIDPKSVDTWRNQKGIKCFLNNNHIYKLSDSTRQKEGRNIDMAGIDEIWSLEDDGIYKPIQQSTSTKDEFKIFMFGSEGFIDDGFLDQKRKEYTAIIYGEDDTDAAKRKLPWIYSQDSESEVWDTGADGISRLWEKSNPSIGTVKKYSYLKDRVDEARKSKSDRAFVLAKDFNFKVNNSEAWLLSELVEYLGEYQLDDFRGTIALGSVDLAETTDLCSAKALVMLPDDDTKYFRSMYWIPESKLELAPDTEAGARYKEWAREGLIRIVDGNDIDISLVADWFYELHKEEGITVYKVGYDQKFSKEFLNRMDEYGFDTEMILQNRYVLSNPMRLVETELKKQLVNCNDNPIDKWCLKNTAVQVWDTGHIMPIKQKGQNGKRIDGSLTFIMCYEMLRRYRSDYKILVDRKRG